MRRVGLLLLVASLACTGLNGVRPVDLVDVNAERTAELGFDVPPGATSIFVRDRGALGLRTTWFKYTLQPGSLAILQEELRADPAVQPVGVWAVPPDWPAFSDAGFDAPYWWQPAGETYRARLPEAGRQWALGDTEVYVWMWADARSGQ